MAAVVTISHLVKKYGAFTALSDVSLTVGAGEFLTLLGPSGSGKTTLLMSLAGFADPDSGSIRIGDREIMGVEPHKRNIGMVFQSYALFPHMTVGENVAYPLKLRGVGRADREERSRRVLSAVQMPGYEDRRIDQLSGGQRQRVAVARAIVFEPDIILMDEPLSALDKKLREELQIELKHLHRRLGSTTIYVTHDQKEALTLSDRIAVMNRGQIVQIAKPQEMYEQPASAFVADFIGYSLLLPIASSDSSSADKSQLGALASNVRLGRPDDYQAKLPDLYRAITKQQIDTAAGKYLAPGDLAIIVVGDRKVIDQQLSGLDLPIEYDDTDTNVSTQGGDD